MLAHMEDVYDFKGQRNDRNFVACMLNWYKYNQMGPDE